MQKILDLNLSLLGYIDQVSLKEHPILTKVRDYTSTLDNAQMQTPPTQAQFMGLLAKISKAKRYLEIGVFTGYSSLSMALAMGADSEIYALDNNPNHLEIAQKYWQEAMVDQQIHCFNGLALDSLAKLSLDKQNYFDIAFIDANKGDYIKYYEYCYQLVKTGGIILIDNVLFHSQVVAENPSNTALAIKRFNEYIYNDTRVDISLLPIADGLTIAYKKDL